MQVIIVKLADRLHNMRTVWALKPEKSQALAQETLQVRLPVSARLSCLVTDIDQSQSPNARVRSMPPPT